MARRDRHQTAPPPAPVAPEGSAGSQEPTPAPAAPAGDNGAAALEEFAGAIGGGGEGLDPEAAAKSLSQAEMFAAPAPDVQQPPKRGRGRPAGSKTKAAPVSGASPSPQRPTGSPVSQGMNRERMSKAELISLVESQDAQLSKYLPSDAVTVADISEARKTVEGLLQLANTLLVARNVPEFVTSPSDNVMLADASAELLAPYMRQLGEAQPFVRLGIVAMLVYGPKVNSYQARVRAEAAGRSPELRGKTEVSTAPAPEPVPSAATLSGGYSQ